LRDPLRRRQLYRGHVRPGEVPGQLLRSRSGGPRLRDQLPADQRGRRDLRRTGQRLRRAHRRG
jgi:hypothetical protein